ncbi:MAG: hypothetical protein Q8934_03935 [Bacillota bacterium]|nr:hypothetical protein [Bacillota bacterium]
MSKKFFFYACVLELFFLSFLSHPVYAHFVEKPSGHVDVRELLLPDDDLTLWEKILIYCIDGLLIILALTLISMLLRRKKVGKILILFLVVLAIDYVIVLHYGSILDLLG